MNEHTPPTGEQIITAASGLMHQIRTGRINAKSDDPGIRADIKPFLCGEWDSRHGEELEAVNIIAEVAGYGPDAHPDGEISSFWIDGFGKELTLVRTTQGIINKAHASAERMNTTGESDD